MTELGLNLVNSYELQESINFNDELLKQYSRYLQVNEMSKETYLNNAKKFIEWLAGNCYIDSNTLLDYRAYLIANYKATAINTYIVAVKSLFNFLETLGFRNYAKGLKGVKVNNKIHKRDSLTLEQVKEIFNNIDTSTIEGARDYALIKLLIGAGLRQCEVVNADIGDIQTIGNKKVLYIQGKGYNNAKDNISDYVELKPSVLNAIQSYLKFRVNAKDSEPLFISLSDRNKGERLTTRTIRNLVKKLYKDNGIVSERITTHSTRHTAITLSLIAGAGLQETQALARHTNINTTMIYSHNLNRLSDSNAETKLESLLNN